MKATSGSRGRPAAFAAEKSMPGMLHLWRYAARGLPTRLLAAEAGFGADAAMLVTSCVTLAFRCTSAACRGAGLQHLAQHRFVRAGAAGCDRGRGRADVGAVEVETNALGEVLYHLLAEARIRAGNAGLRACGDLFTTTDEHLVDVSSYMRVLADHFAKVVH